MTSVDHSGEDGLRFTRAPSTISIGPLITDASTQLMITVALRVRIPVILVSTVTLIAGFIVTNADTEKMLELFMLTTRTFTGY